MDREDDTMEKLSQPRQAAYSFYSLVLRWKKEREWSLQGLTGPKEAFCENEAALGRGAYKEIEAEETHIAYTDTYSSKRVLRRKWKHLPLPRREKRS